MAKILLIGQSGQLGSELKRALRAIGTVIASASRGGAGSQEVLLDLADVESVKRCLATVRPDIVVNAAAYTSVDGAETQPRLARAVNATGPYTLASSLASSGGLLVHYSTDYVFDGNTSRAYKPEDTTAPVNMYGETKLAGEDAIRQSGARHLILRTSMVYGATGQNFATTMLALLRSGKELRVVDDQIASPTWTRALAVYTSELLTRAHRTEGLRYGTYHVAGSGCCSRYEFVRRIADHLSLPTSRLHPIPTTEFPTPATRPLYSVLDCAGTHTAFGLKMDSWESHLRQVLDELEL